MATELVTLRRAPHRELAPFVAQVRMVSREAAGAKCRVDHLPDGTSSIVSGCVSPARATHRRSERTRHLLRQRRQLLLEFEDTGVL